jgi:hypothetical protein
MGLVQERPVILPTLRLDHEGFPAEAREASSLLIMKRALETRPAQSAGSVGINELVFPIHSEGATRLTVDRAVVQGHVTSSRLRGPARKWPKRRPGGNMPSGLQGAGPVRCVSTARTAG